ncbi:flagellar motor protein MotB [Bacillus sp. 31A1R]|uniref:Flagellar motor protein MotB n=1 Tax=Robertmurraya mangrovi TaxID=3098077 RepID=A0ABU5J2D6_9BACI|nr:flagellar motor protein MotB [Bacillus sp. 31A1R]MDZ5473522.1 flagellar motor protein MotB [Bacillus sp. 31A1R]
MSKRGKKHHHEEHVDESWLIPYADLLTLLLALFIVLFSMSSLDAKKFQAMSEVFNEAFSSGTGIFEYPSPIPEDKAAAPDEQEKEEDQEKTDKKEKAKIDQEKREMLAKQADKRELESIEKKVNSYIKDKKLSDQLEATMTDEGLLVMIRDNVLFESGSDEVRRQDLKIAEEISDLLVMSPPRNIVISGHTDNVPIKNARFSSNWELSVMRSINFMKILLENDQLDPSWFSAKGFGEFNPIASNKTTEGKAKNRRVEILILPRN